MLCGCSYLPASLRSLLRVIWRRGNQTPGAHLSPSLPRLQLAACEGAGEGQMLMLVETPEITPHYSARSTPQVLLLEPACFGNEKEIYLFEILSPKHLLSAPSQHAHTFLPLPLPLAPTTRRFLFQSPPQDSRFSRKNRAAVLLLPGAEGSQGTPGSPDQGGELTARAAAACRPCTGCTAASPCASSTGRARQRTAAGAAGTAWPARGLPRSPRCLAGKAP